MDTADGGVDDALDQWVVENFKEMSPEVHVADKDFSKVNCLRLASAITASLCMLNDYFCDVSIMILNVLIPCS
jgi:hypothetical protein